ncbi:type VI secretion system ATPase TssH [Moellerella wisconsensis]|uniref:Type VI secretion system ATPase TssH n=1 Tax=Moellerella wisconsensis TaxID=158849 RepID=A0A9Q8V5Z3_9GAMM|nr:type VI secretion system ATPase TssH [Moellerella wisconsensis]UNH32196.1 type VI secretion system ATPase TssH [Moellerella wisconsensis]
MDNSSVMLLRRLNPYCASALEAAASLCQTRAHAEITIEHWLLKLLEMGESDLTVLARRYEWDISALWQSLLNEINNLPRSIHSRPCLSKPLLNLIQQAWIIASLDEDIEHIRSVHLLSAITQQPSLLPNDNLWPLMTLSTTQLQRLRPVLDAQSDERPDLQQLAAHNQVIGRETPLDSPLTEETTTPNLMGNTLNEALLAVLNKFTIDVTEKAREGAIDPVFGRDDEIRQMVDILSRRRKNNPILVGEPGVGKTALVEGLALRIIEGNVPVSLQTTALRTLDLGLLQAGAGVKGEFEQRLKNVIEAVQQSPTPILLFIDEAHTIIGAGNQAGGADAANLLKPALARGELRTIAATTWSEYKQYFERDAALERRFQVVKVDEPDDEKAFLMLRGLKSRYAKYHGVHITDDAVKAAVTLSRRYLSGRQLPDKAVDLLDTASARIRMSLDTQPEEITYLKTKRNALKLEQHAILDDLTIGNTTNQSLLSGLVTQDAQIAIQLAELEQRFEQEKNLISELMELRRQTQDISEIQSQLDQVQQNEPLITPDVDVRTVATVIADWTGVPLSSLLKDQQTGLLELEANLAQRVVGQNHALLALGQRLRATRTGLTSENGPQGVFLLVGPSGIGKTETALALADQLFGGEKALITINMSEYQEAHTVSQLKGSPPGYVGYGQGGILTEAVRKRPYSVVLLDEVEKAHRDVLNMFYQVFDRGFMRDGEGREIDFRNTVILMTANLGSDLLMQQLEEFPESTDGELQELLRPTLRDHFQPALLARFQTLIYRPLGQTALRTIVEMKLNSVMARLQLHYGLTGIVEDTLYDALVSACLLPDTGARNIDSLLNQQILPVLSQQLLMRQENQLLAQTLTLGFNDEDGIILSFSGEMNTSSAQDSQLLENNL